MNNPYHRDDAASAAEAQALEELICWSAEDFGVGSNTSIIQQHTDFELPNDNGALVVVRFTGEGAVEKAKRLRKLIDAWS